MSVARVVLYVRRRMAELGLVDTDTQEKRTPSRDRYVLKASLSVTIARLQIIKDMEGQLGLLYQGRTPEELTEVVEQARVIEELAHEVHAMLQKCHTPIPMETAAEAREALAV